MKALKLGTQTASVVNWIDSGAKEPTPVVGMGCTFLHWTDRSPAEIVTVNETTGVIGVRDMDATRTDARGMSEQQTYEYTSRPDAPVVEYARNASGVWCKVRRYTKAGRPMLHKEQGPRLTIGYAEKYHDWSF